MLHYEAVIIAHFASHTRPAVYTSSSCPTEKVPYYALDKSCTPLPYIIDLMKRKTCPAFFISDITPARSRKMVFDLGAELVMTDNVRVSKAIADSLVPEVVLSRLARIV